MQRINADEYFMRLVYLTASRSKDSRTKIGAVLVKGGEVCSSGFNGFPRKVKDLEERYNNRDLKLRMVAHAEFNCLINAARLGISTLNTILYTNGIVCSECCKAVIQSGVKEIVVHSSWPNLTHSPQWVFSIELSKMMLEEVNIPIRVFDKILNMQGFLDGKIINV